MQKRLSIMVPALNEEENLKAAIKEIKKGLKDSLKDYEILIFDDGSTDKTGKIADSLAKKAQRIRAFHNGVNRGTGYCYLKGLKLARYEHYMYIPGDNQFPADALKRMTARLGEADIIIPYVENMHIRPLLRRIISSAFTALINHLFDLQITYYNAPVIHKTAVLRGVPERKNSGHAYQAAVLVSLIKSGASYVEVGFKMYERRAGGTSAFTPKNIIRVIRTVISLFWEVRIRKNPAISAKTRRLLAKPV